MRNLPLRLAGCAASVALALSLGACGTKQEDVPEQTAATQEPAEAAPAPKDVFEAPFDHATVEYEGWTLEFTDAFVTFSEESEDDVMQVRVRATNNTDEAASFYDLDNFHAYPAGSDESLDWPYGSDEQGRDWYDLDAELDEVEPGDSIELLFGWTLGGSYGDVNLRVMGYVESDDDTDVPFEGLEQTAECAAYEQAMQAELDEKIGSGEAAMVGASLSKADGWFFDTLENKRVVIAREDGSSGTITLQFSTVSDTPFERALYYGENYGFGEAEIQTATIAGQEWCYFLSDDDQFEAFGQATDGIVSANGMFVTWDEAQAVLEGITLT